MDDRGLELFHGPFGVKRGEDSGTWSFFSDVFNAETKNDGRTDRRANGWMEGKDGKDGIGG